MLAQRTGPKIGLAMPMIAVGSIGQGGGSIARLTADGIRVGRESAGSVPGPAAYNKGGMEPTVTDANLVLGLIDPAYFLGGRMALDVSRAFRAIERRVARPLGTSVAEAALGIRDACNEDMACNLAQRLRARGQDPREFTLFSFGGSGPLRALDIAERCGIGRVVAFPYGSVFSAYGISTIDVQHMYAQTFGAPPEELEGLDETVLDLRRQAVRDMLGEGFAEETPMPCGRHEA